MREICGKQVYDSLGEIVNPKHTAVVVVDMENDFCSPAGYAAKLGLDISMLAEVMPNLVRFVEGAREAGVMVVFIQHTNLSEGHSASPSWLRCQARVFGAVPEFTIDGTWGQGFCAGLEPKANEPIIKKHRSSAFVETDLDLVLRCNGIESIIITGCVTHGCVMATARHGAFYDYYVVVVRDCVGSTDRKLHEAALMIMDTSLDVVSSQEILKEWA